MKRVTCHRSAALLALLTVLVAACAPAEGAPEQPTGPVRLGLLVPPSGERPGGPATQAEEGVRLAIDVVNDRHGDVPLPLASSGGLPGLGGAQVTLAVGNTTESGRQAEQEVDRMVDGEGAVAVLAFGDSAEIALASQRAEPYGVPFLGVGSSQEVLTERGLEWFFRLGPTDADYADAFLNVLLRQPGGSVHSHLAVVYPADQKGAATGFDVAEAASQRGHDVVRVPVNPDESTSASAVAVALEAQGADQADGVVLVAHDERSARAATQAAAGLPGTFLDAGPNEVVTDSTDTPVLGLGDGFGRQSTLENLSASFPGLLTGSAWSAEAAERGQVGRFVTELYAERFGRPMTPEAAEAFTVTYALLRATDTAGSTEPGTLRAALLGLHLPGRELVVPWDGVSFDELHQNAGARAVIERLTEGQRVLVEPAELAGPTGSPSAGSNPTSGSG